MYTFEERRGDDSDLDEEDVKIYYAILDPEGDELAVVHAQVEAETLVSHLNR